MNNNQQKSNMKALLMKTEVSMVAIIGLIFILAAVGTENFLTAYNLTNILKQCAIIGIISIACAMATISVLMPTTAPQLMSMPPVMMT